LGDDLFVLFGRQPSLAEQVFLETIDGIALAPVLVHLFGDIGRGVVDGVAFHAHQFGLDQGWAFAAMGALDGLVGCVINLAGIGAVDDHARHAVADGAVGQVLYRYLVFRRR